MFWLPAVDATAEGGQTKAAGEADPEGPGPRSPVTGTGTVIPEGSSGEGALGAAKEPGRASTVGVEVEPNVNPETPVPGNRAREPWEVLAKEVTLRCCAVLVAEEGMECG